MGATLTLAAAGVEVGKRRETLAALDFVLHA